MVLEDTIGAVGAEGLMLATHMQVFSFGYGYAIPPLKWDISSGGIPFLTWGPNSHPSMTTYRIPSIIFPRHPSPFSSSFIGSRYLAVSPPDLVPITATMSGTTQPLLSGLSLPPMPDKTSEWASIIPLVCHPANKRDDYTTDGKVTLAVNLSAGC